MTFKVLDFKSFIKLHKLKNQATSAKKLFDVAKKIKLKDFDIYLRNQPLKTKQGIVNLDTTKGSHWVCFYENNYFDAYGVKPPLEVENSLKTGIYSSYQIQSSNPNDQLCGSYCLYVLYLINSGMSFEDAVIKLFFQKKNSKF